MRRFIVLCICIFGCGGDEPAVETWIDTRTSQDPPPNLISEIGIFGDRTSVPHPAAISFEPLWPLWSNGLGKERLIVVPEGESIDTTGRDWQFPTGTLLFKTFTDDHGPVETRVMWNSPNGWEWSAYVWSADKSDAERADGRRSIEVEVTVDGETFVHKVPNELDCKKCHEPDANGVIGFEPLQLGSQVERHELFDRSPEPQRIEADDSDTEAVLGYFLGNCTSCHNGLGSHDQSSFDLSPSVALTNTINQETEDSASTSGIRVVPGEPENSVLFVAVSGEGADAETKLMPPVGVQVRDNDAIELLRKWIEALP